jgi:hypothetical protein
VFDNSRDEQRGFEVDNPNIQSLPSDEQETSLEAEDDQDSTTSVASSGAMRQADWPRESVEQDASQQSVNQTSNSAGIATDAVDHLGTGAAAASRPDGLSEERSDANTEPHPQPDAVDPLRKRAYGALELEPSPTPSGTRLSSVDESSQLSALPISSDKSNDTIEAISPRPPKKRPCTTLERSQPKRSRTARREVQNLSLRCTSVYF